jgi:cob(I)alamin adenosyltransferase
MVLFTGKGDDGTTTLFGECGGARKTKSAPEFECLGMLDELNAMIGWCRIVCSADLAIAGSAVLDMLHDVQDHLFTLQAEVAGAAQMIPQGSVDKLGTIIGEIEKELPETRSFLLLGQTELSARLDMARALSRRAERRIVVLHESGDLVISPGSQAYANRLSSLLYALARLSNHRSGIVEDSPHYRGIS